MSYLKMPAAAVPLTDSARLVLEAVVAQLARYDEAVTGLCSETEVTHVRRGRIGPKREPEQRTERLDEEDGALAGLDILPLLAGDDYESMELPPPSPESVLIRSIRRAPLAASDAPAAGDFLFSRDPARLVKAWLRPTRLPLMVRLLVERLDLEVLYGYVHEVPMPVKSVMRMRSRGVGSLRIDQEAEMVVRYAPCG